MSVKDKSGFTPREFVYATALKALDKLRDQVDVERRIPNSINFNLAGNPRQEPRYATEGEAKQIAEQAQKLIEKLSRAAAFDF